jgi:class 3 adenylate cyclase/WD40 repeat protein
MTEPRLGGDSPIRGAAGQEILTFLIADVRGYTSFTQRMGDVAAAALAAKFAEIAREGVEAHGGSVIELRGDEALAVFGSARQAIRAATELALTFADETARAPEIPLTVGIGLDAGEAVRVEAGYRGGALNLAARLQARAEPYEALASQTVIHLARVVSGVRYEERGPLELKGLAEPVTPYRLIAEDVPAVIPSGDAAATPIPDLPLELDPISPLLAGREREVRWLRWSWRQARRGAGGTAVVTGAPGVGTTRLVAELATIVYAEGVRVLYASASGPDEALAGVIATSRSVNVPSLVVLDDLEAADANSLQSIADLIRASRGRAQLLVAVHTDEGRDSKLPALLGAAGPISEQRIPALDTEAVREIACAYAGEELGREVPAATIIQRTGGVPQGVQREVAEWARQQASRKLFEASTRAAAGRSELRSIEARVASNLFDVQLVSERANLLGSAGKTVQGVDSASPYKGLASFEMSDAALFFGRERLVGEMVARLAGSSFLAVVGPSGSGKSSAVRAGLLPALAEGALAGSPGWQRVLIRPGDHPLRELDRALYAVLSESERSRLSSDGDPLANALAVVADERRLVLVIDQFEEVFTAGAAQAEQTGFVNALVGAAEASPDRVVIVIAVRADYYGRCATYPGLARLLATNHVLVGPMEAAEYRRAIEQPARRAGARVEPSLGDALVTEVVDEPGGLPLLSSALLELWQQRTGRTIRMEAYVATGGFRGAIARLAEAAYQDLDEADRRIARSILLRLAGPGEGDAVVRRRVPLSELEVERNQPVERVLDRLATARLLTVSQGAAEVAHEALLREWPRLAGWLEEDREGARLRQHLITAAREWEDADRDPGELYRGARLSAALDWTTEHSLELNELEREFVTTSRAQSQHEFVKQQRQNRRLRGLLAGVAALLILAIAAGSIALIQRQSADTAARKALARQLGAEALSDSRIDQAMLLARQAVLLDNNPQTQGTLLATLLRSPAVVSTFTVPITQRPLQLALSGDARTLAIADNGGGVRFIDTSTHGQIGARLPDVPGGFPPGTMTFAGPYFVAPSVPPTGLPSIDIFDTRTMHPVRKLAFNQTFLNSNTGQFDPLFASSDGSTVYFAWTLVNEDRSDGPAFLESWNVASGEHRLAALGANGIDGAAAITGNRVLVVTDATAITVDGASLQTIRSVPIMLGSRPVAIGPTGQTLAAQSGEGRQQGDTFSLVDLTSGTRTPAAGSHAGPIDGMTFTPDGTTLITTGSDGAVILWDATTAAPIETLSGHSGRVVGQAVSSDGSTLYTSGLDGVIFQWDLSGARRFGRPFNLGPSSALPQRSFPVPPLATAPDSSRYAVRIGPGMVAIYEVAIPRLEEAFNTSSSGDVVALAWSRTRQLAVGTVRGMELWDVSGAPRLATSLSGVTGTVQAVGFSPDGGTIAAVTDIPAQSASQSDSGWLGVWDAASGHLRASRQLDVAGESLAFDPQASQLAIGTGDGRVLLVDAATVRTEQTLHPAEGPLPIDAVAFQADGVLLTGSNAGIVQEWNPATGAQVGHAVLVEAAPVSSLTVDPASKAFATSGGSAGGVKIWDEQSLQQFGATFPGGAGHWGNAEYTPDGANIVVVYSDGTAAVWPVSVSAWMDHACAVARRNFTQEEWSRFVPNQPYQRTCPDLSAG